MNTARAGEVTPHRTCHRNVKLSEGRCLGLHTLVSKVHTSLWWVHVCCSLSAPRCHSYTSGYHVFSVKWSLKSDIKSVKAGRGTGTFEVVQKRLCLFGLHCKRTCNHTVEDCYQMLLATALSGKLICIMHKLVIKI